MSEDIYLNNRKELPQEIKNKKKKVVFKNFMILIAVIIYFIFILLGYHNIEKSIYITDLHVFSVILLTISIILFERGFYKDNESIFFNGIEVLVIAFVTLIMPYTLFDASNIVNVVFSQFYIIFIIYYCIKSIFQLRKIKKEFFASDIKELVKR